MLKSNEMYMLVGLSLLLLLKPCMSSLVASGSQRICPTERSRSSFVFVVSFVCKLGSSCSF
jgi:hypothetical protein